MKLSSCLNFCSFLWGGILLCDMSVQVSFLILGCEFLLCRLLGRKRSWLIGSEGFIVDDYSDLSPLPAGVSHCRKVFCVTGAIKAYLIIFVGSMYLTVSSLILWLIYTF